MSTTPDRRPVPILFRLGYALSFIVIAAALAVIGWRLYASRSGTSGERVISREAVATLLSRPLLIDESHTLRLGDSRAEYLVVFLFTPADCAACLPELSGLSRLAQERKDLEVVAVMGFSNPSEALQTKQSFGLEIPIVQDPYGELIEAVAPPRTPWKLVIRRADQRVLFESPPAVEADAQRAFISRLRQLRKGSEDAGAG
jgi:hypothetical protein